MKTKIPAALVAALSLFSAPAFAADPPACVPAVPCEIATPVVNPTVAVPTVENRVATAEKKIHDLWNKEAAHNKAAQGQLAELKNKLELAATKADLDNVEKRLEEIGDALVKEVADRKASEADLDRKIGDEAVARVTADNKLDKRVTVLESRAPILSVGLGLRGGLATQQAFKGQANSSVMYGKFEVDPLHFETADGAFWGLKGHFLLGTEMTLGGGLGVEIGRDLKPLRISFITGFQARGVEGQNPTASCCRANAVGGEADLSVGSSGFAKGLVVDLRVGLNVEESHANDFKGKGIQAFPKMELGFTSFFGPKKADETK